MSARESPVQRLVRGQSSFTSSAADSGTGRGRNRVVICRCRAAQMQKVREQCVHLEHGDTICSDQLSKQEARQEQNTRRTPVERPPTRRQDRPTSLRQASPAPPPPKISTERTRGPLPDLTSISTPSPATNCSGIPSTETVTLPAVHIHITQRPPTQLPPSSPQHDTA